MLEKSANYKEERMAGKKWFYSFNRNPQPSLLRLETTSMARAEEFNRENVIKFFDLLEKTVDKNTITANTVFNVEESGLTAVQQGHIK